MRTDADRHQIFDRPPTGLFHMHEENRLERSTTELAHDAAASQDRKGR